MQRNSFIDYYSLLGLPFDATKEQVEINYKNALLQSDTVSQQHSLLDLAYTVLSDDNKRKVYDETYTKLQKSLTTEDADNQQPDTLANYVQEDADHLLEETKERFVEFDQFVSEQLNNKNADEQFKTQTADKAESLYKRGMWPLLDNLKDLTGEVSPIYLKACEIHSKAILSLGDLCMWAAHYERAIGMYNTALVLSANNHELTLRCAKAVSLAKLAFEENRVTIVPQTSTKMFPDEESKEKLYYPFAIIFFFVMLGFFFTVFCLWGVLVLLDTVFLP